MNNIRIPNESYMDSKAPDPNVVEGIFGKPDSPKSGIPPNTYIFIANETKHDKDALKNGERDPEDPPSSQPLLEPPTGLPLASPEIDDLDGEHLKNTIQFPDIDDGLLDSNEKPPEPKEGEEEHGVNDSQDNVGGEQDGDGVPELGGRSNFPENTDDTSPRRVDENAYQQRKNLAHGMMDVALMSANANQLRYVLEWRDPHPYYYPSLVLISLSIIFQIAVGIGLILNSRYHENSRDSENEDDKKQHREEMIKANNNNNLILMGVFFITIVNVFITCFSVATPSSAPRAAPTGCGAQMAVAPCKNW